MYLASQMLEMIVAGPSVSVMLSKEFNPICFSINDFKGCMCLQIQPVNATDRICTSTNQLTVFSFRHFNKQPLLGDT
jgi:hypothetical protein